MVERTDIKDLESDEGVKQIVHFGTEVKCDSIDTIQSSNSYACCTCSKKVPFSQKLSMLSFTLKY